MRLRNYIKKSDSSTINSCYYTNEMCQINHCSVIFVKRNDFNSLLSIPDYTKTTRDIVHRTQFYTSNNSAAIF